MQLLLHGCQSPESGVVGVFFFCCCFCFLPPSSTEYSSHHYSFMWLVNYQAISDRSSSNTCRSNCPCTSNFTVTPPPSFSVLYIERLMPSDVVKSHQISCQTRHYQIPLYHSLGDLLLPLLPNVLTGAGTDHLVVIPHPRATSDDPNQCVRVFPIKGALSIL